MKQLKWLSTLVVFALSLSVLAKDPPARPDPPKLVNDYANVLSSEERDALEHKLTAYFDSTSTQIAIVIEPSLDGDDLFDYSQRLATAWGIGEKGKNNGVLIYASIGDRKARIHTGYGMEATITDALTTRIRQEHLNPNFKQGNYYQGLDEATDVIMRAASGEYINDRKKDPSTRGVSAFVVIFVIIILLFSIFRGRGGRGGRGGLMGPIIWGTFGSGGFSSGSGFGGGSGGGGFGGFGGGGFGGGGSGGSW